MFRGVKAGISFAPALGSIVFGKCCFEQPLPFGRARRVPSRCTKPAREIRRAATGSFLESPESGPSDRVLDLHPRLRAADQLSNILACRMITFTFLRSFDRDLKETFDATPPDAALR
jgi:hypothetical protein